MIELMNATAWPLVGLILILFLFPGGYLKEILKSLAAIPTSIEKLQHHMSEFKTSEATILASAGQLSELTSHLNKIETQLQSMQTLTADLARETFAKLHDESDEDSQSTIGATGKPPRELYAMIESRWSELCHILKAKVGEDQFDARSVGTAASKLADEERLDGISHKDAENINNLFSTMKRFRRMKESLDSWMNDDVYTKFIKNLDEGVQALRA